MPFADLAPESAFTAAEIEDAVKESKLPVIDEKKKKKKKKKKKEEEEEAVLNDVEETCRPMRALPVDHPMHKRLQSQPALELEGNSTSERLGFQ